MSSEIAALAIVEVVGHLRAYLCKRDFEKSCAKPHRFDGHAMMKLIDGVESGSVALMQQRVAQVIAGLELGYQFEGAQVTPSSRHHGGGWTPYETVRLVGHCHLFRHTSHATDGCLNAYKCNGTRPTYGPVLRFG
jgi:hypothetical protein